jgi:hypothetical protein
MMIMKIMMTILMKANVTLFLRVLYSTIDLCRSILTALGYTSKCTEASTSILSIIATQQFSFNGDKIQFFKRTAFEVRLFFYNTSSSTSWHTEL